MSLDLYLTCMCLLPSFSNKVIVHTTADMLRNAPPGESGSMIRVKRLRSRYQSDDDNDDDDPMVA